AGTAAPTARGATAAGATRPTGTAASAATHDPRHRHDPGSAEEIVSRGKALRARVKHEDMARVAGDEEVVGGDALRGRREREELDPRAVACGHAAPPHDFVVGPTGGI